MKCSKLKNEVNKTTSSDDLIKYKKQRSLVFKLNKNCKKEFLDNLEIKNNSKPFWDKDIVNDLSWNKAAGGEIPLKILKECDFSFHFLTNCIDEAINKNNEFPSSSKLSNIVPVHKKKDPTNKTNYRPVCILPLLSRVFEKIM